MRKPREIRKCYNWKCDGMFGRRRPGRELKIWKEEHLAEIRKVTLKTLGAYLA